MEKDNEAEPVSIILGNENLLMNYPDLLKGKRGIGNESEWSK